MTPTRLVRAALAAALATGVLAACAQIPDAGSVNNEEAKKIYPDGWQEPKPYIRIVPQPGEVRTAAIA